MNRVRAIPFNRRRTAKNTAKQKAAIVDSRPVIDPEAARQVTLATRNNPPRRRVAPLPPAITAMLAMIEKEAYQPRTFLLMNTPRMPPSSGIQPRPGSAAA